MSASDDCPRAQAGPSWTPNPDWGFYAARSRGLLGRNEKSAGRWGRGYWVQLKKSWHCETGAKPAIYKIFNHPSIPDDFGAKHGSEFVTTAPQPPAPASPWLLSERRCINFHFRSGQQSQASRSRKECGRSRPSGSDDGTTDPSRQDPSVPRDHGWSVPPEPTSRAVALSSPQEEPETRSPSGSCRGSARGSTSAGRSGERANSRGIAAYPGSRSGGG
jgi:hypothetical protein